MSVQDAHRDEDESEEESTDDEVPVMQIFGQREIWTIPINSLPADSGSGKFFFFFFFRLKKHGTKTLGKLARTVMMRSWRNGRRS